MHIRHHLPDLNTDVRAAYCRLDSRSSGHSTETLLDQPRSEKTDVHALFNHIRCCGGSQVTKQYGGEKAFADFLGKLCAVQPVLTVAVDLLLSLEHHLHYSKASCFRDSLTTPNVRVFRRRGDRAREALSTYCHSGMHYKSYLDLVLAAERHMRWRTFVSQGTQKPTMSSGRCLPSMSAPCAWPEDTLLGSVEHHPRHFKASTLRDIVTTLEVRVFRRRGDCARLGLIRERPG